MRRGLISWSRDEVPVAAMEQRVARLQEGMRREGMDAVLVHTSIARPSAVSWLTQFVPYWNEGVLVVPARGGPTLLAAFSKRVQEWIREVSYLEDVMTAPKLGEGVLSLLERRLPDFARRGAKVGLLERDSFPWSIAEPIVKRLGGASVVDAGPLFASIRQPADESEIGLARHALALANKGMACVPPGAKQASQALAAIDHAARLDGAEEVFFRVAPDLAQHPTLVRIETDAVLGERWALQLSLAYKGIWVRIAKCFAQGAAPASWTAAEQWFTRAALRLPDSAPEALEGAPGRLTLWTLEACVGSEPLTVSAYGPARMQQSLVAPSKALPRGSLAVFSAQLELPEGAWHGAAPVVLGANERRTELLAPR